ncbi:MAG: hypothetical protein MH204_04820, partial [Fimbriimonadaceae bacterium]|nr:hypothetical protein [Fimbriimonadaceae bacterium]
MRSLKIVALAGAAVMAGSALAQTTNQSRPQPRRGPAETSLVGIALFDTGAKVVARFGSPDDIQGLTIGGGAAPGGGGPGGPPGFGPPGGGGGAPGAPQPGAGE